MSGVCGIWLKSLQNCVKSTATIFIEAPISFCDKAYHHYES